MPKINLPSISQIKHAYSQFRFAEHDIFHWSPKDNTVYYDPLELKEPTGMYQLFHEIGHALSDHRNYTSGVQLLKIEAEAWSAAKLIAKKYNLKIDSDRIERCLDSYRDWLHLRSTCPNCESVSLEIDTNSYHCFNCMQKWKVPSDQRSRHYRLKLTSPLPIS